MIVSLLLSLALTPTAGGILQQQDADPERLGFESSTSWLSVQKTIPWNPNLSAVIGAPSFESMLLGDVNGDLEYDACILSKGNLVLGSYLTSLKVISETDTSLPSIMSMVAWDRATFNRTEFVASDALGLNLVLFAHEIVSSDPVSYTPQSGTALMANARDLRLESLGGEKHVVGVAATGNQIVSMKLVKGLWVPGPAWFLGRAVRTFDFLDYLNVGVKDLVVTTANLSAVIAQDGTVHYVKVDPSPSLAVKVVNDANGTADERVAKVVEVAGGGWNLELFNSQTADTPVSLSLPKYEGGPLVDLDPLSLVAGDANLDGYCDLALVSSDRRLLILMVNKGAAGAAAGAQFGTDNVLFLALDENDTTLSNTDNFSLPIIADVDGDLNPDCFISDQYGQRLLLFENLGLLPFNLDSLKIQVGTEAPGIVGFVSDQTTYYRLDDSARELQFAFEGLGSIVFDNYDYLQIRAFDLSKLNGTIDLDPKVNTMFLLDKGAMNREKQFCRLLEDNLFPTSTPLAEDLPWDGPAGIQRVVVIHYRAVTLNSNMDRVLNASYPFIAGFTMQWTDTGDTPIANLSPYFDSMTASEYSQTGNGILVSQGDLTSSGALGAHDSTFVGALVELFIPPPPVGPIGPTLPKSFELDLAELW